MKSASEVIDQGDLGSVVDHTIGLGRKVASLTAELELLKVHLREEAKKLARGANSVELEGHTGSIEVAFPGLTCKVKKGADLKDLEANLEAEVFSELFVKTIEVTHALSPDEYLEALQGLSPAVQKTLSHFIVVEEQTARVYVPR